MKKRCAKFWRSETLFGAAYHRPHRRVLEATCCACILTGLLSCTVIPPVVRDQVPSFDGAAQNSGFIGFDAATNAIITPRARDRYNALIRLHGTNAQFLVPLKPDEGITPTATNTYLLDPQHTRDFGVLNLLHRRIYRP